MRGVAAGVALWGVAAATGAGMARAAGSCAADAALRAALPEQDDSTILVPGGGLGALAQVAGKLWLYDGCRIQTLPPAPKAVTPASSWVFSPTGVWLGVSRKSGDHGGTLLRFDGHAWNAVPGLEKLSAAPVLWASGPDDVWIGSHSGDDLEVYRWDGRRVARVAFGLTEKLPRGVNAIGGSGSADVWVAPDESGWILHGDGKRWVKIKIDSAFHPTSFWSRSPGETWAAGVGNPGRPNLFRWDGARWQGAGMVTGAAQSIVGAGQRMFVALRTGQVLAPDRAAAGGWSAAFSFRNGGLGPDRTPLYDRPPSAWAYLFDLHLPSENRGFALAVRNHALVALHWDGQAWTATGRIPDEVASAVRVSGRRCGRRRPRPRPAAVVPRRGSCAGTAPGSSPSARPRCRCSEISPAPNDGVWAVGAAGTACIARSPAARPSPPAPTRRWSARGDRAQVFARWARAGRSSRATAVRSAPCRHRAGGICNRRGDGSATVSGPRDRRF